MKKFTNKLIHEKSQYLLQHAHNPVHWYPWGKEALLKAKQENKMILISIGYAACHWCHVMERESFEDEMLARKLNENLVCIKVDREERPDLDQTYMSAVQLLTGSGGWPLNCFATPGGRPFYGGTYFRPAEFSEIIDQLVTIWKENPAKIEEHANDLCTGIIQSELIQEKKNDSIFADPEKIFIALRNLFDTEEGGLKRVPKFPMPAIYQFLLHFYHSYRNKGAFDQVKRTVDKIIHGGIYDQLGGGIARYSTDKYWFAPHFEKMLYDNAQFVSLLSSMYQITGEAFYKDKLSEVLEFVERDLSNGEGACFSSLDADSEGIEGRYYIWTLTEFESVCKDHKNLLRDYFGLVSSGNWEKGYNILRVQSSIEELSGKYNMTVEEISTIVSECKNKLFKKRDEREKPLLDDKILTSWNALMITAWCDAFQATGKTEYRLKALTTANFIQNHLYDQNIGRLKRSHGMNISGFLDDYALLSEAFIKLYQISFEEKWMNRAKRLILHSLDHFFDAERDMFFYSPDYESNPVSRQTEITDNVISSSNSVMARVLFLTGIFFDDREFTGISKQMLLNTQSYLRKSPEFFANWGSLLLLYTHKFSEVVLTGDNAMELREDFCGKYLPDVLFALSNGPSDLPLLKDRYREGENLIYVCRNQSCQLPVKEVGKAIEQLEE